MISLLQQIKIRRLALGFKQSEMPLKIGVSRQQYQHLEAKGNPQLDTLQLIAKGLNSELMLIPQEKLDAVMAVLGSNTKRHADKQSAIRDASTVDDKRTLSDDPWQGLLGDDMYD
jgi:transcriptional regulator with XRE-family HTH domain